MSKIIKPLYLKKVGNQTILVFSKSFHLQRSEQEIKDLVEYTQSVSLNFENVMDTDIEYLYKRKLKFKYLEIKYADFLTPVSMELIGQLQQLEHLSIHRSPLIDAEILFIYSLFISSLEFNDCQHLSDLFFKAVLEMEGFPLLRSLSITLCPSLSNSFCSILSEFQELTELSLSELSFKDSDLAPLSTLRNLQSLSLMYFPYLTIKSLHFLVSSLSLKNVNVSGCPQLTSLHNPLSSTPCVDWLGSPLKSLTLSYCKGIPEDHISSLSRQQSLTFLNLSGCTQLSSKIIQNMVISHPSLKFLFLEECTQLESLQIPRSTLLSISLLSCTSLSNLDISLQRSVSVYQNLESFSDLLRVDSPLKRTQESSTSYFLKLDGCNKLETISIQGQSSFPIEDIIQFSNLSSLTFLNFKDCKQITDDCLHKTIHSLTNLTKLNIGGCSELTDRGMTIISKLSQLESLTLSSISKLTELGMNFIGLLKQLKELDLENCIKINDSCIESITNLIELRFLNLRGCKLLTSSTLIHLTFLITKMKIEIRNSFKILIDLSYNKQIFKIPKRCSFCVQMYGHETKKDINIINGICSCCSRVWIEGKCLSCTRRGYSIIGGGGGGIGGMNSSRNETTTITSSTSPPPSSSPSLSLSSCHDISISKEGICNLCKQRPENLFIVPNIDPNLCSHFKKYCPNVIFFD